MIAARPEVVPVPTDAHGMRTDLLDEALARTGAHLVVAQPLYANPTGTTLAPERRARLLDTAARHSAFVIEDDYARDLAIDTPVPPPTLMSEDETGHVVHVRSLTKTIAPGLRVAALAARGPALTRLRAAKALDDLYVSGPLQATALDFLTSTALPRHLRGVSRQLAHRRDTLLRALAAHLPEADVTCAPGRHARVGQAPGRHRFRRPRRTRTGSRSSRLLGHPLVPCRTRRRLPPPHLRRNLRRPDRRRHPTSLPRNVTRLHDTRVIGTAGGRQREDAVPAAGRPARSPAREAGGCPAGPGR
ncbi:aminotransferase class I/II-fold pyridoxal phosphate-dependent enzyme [Kitasatospora sp. NPDC057542]|uniref:aminotransferase class I/II-fold pyridoxal phosphate-dependent enzyme n=1 Tax=Kitasatospora sp. NPDC057542 TaxID=3346162 RepID=UPI00368AB99F